jgi:hypothetical protein
MTKKRVIKPVHPTAPEDQPILDFTYLSWADNQRLIINGSKVQKAHETNDLDVMVAVAADQQQIMATVIKHVPQSWLVPSAPADLDWSDPNSLGYVQAQKMGELMGLFQQLSENPKA